MPFSLVQRFYWWALSSNISFEHFLCTKQLNSHIRCIFLVLLFECSICEKRKILSSDGANLGSKKCKAMMASLVPSGGACFWWESGVRRSVLCWCVWHEFRFGRREDFFSHLFHLIKTLYKLCTFNAIWKGRSYNKLYHCSARKCLFLSTVTGRALVWMIKLTSSFGLSKFTWHSV
jgi:hypothetical protein